ncbi:MAG TPA: M23 family metallopeptidase [Vicinamibacterales bacterium]|nr:M23 family metallopeptidase [Vicinamibacterales bacterium]
MTAETSRPALRYLVASGLLGFVLGAFVVASLGSINTLAGRAALLKPTAGDAIDDHTDAVVEVPSPTNGRKGIIPSSAPEAKELVDRHLTIPVEGVKSDKLVNSYHDARSGGREHEAIDILAPRNTPILAVEDGTIARLFLSRAGGTTIYQFDPTRQYCYYYAHLERYAAGLKEGDEVHRGQVLGYVGTSGDAPKNTPHLHFAAFRLTPEKHWWEGTPINPYDVLR